MSTEPRRRGDNTLQLPQVGLNEVNVCNNSRRVSGMHVGKLHEIQALESNGRVNVNIGARSVNNLPTAVSGLHVLFASPVEMCVIQTVGVEFPPTVNDETILLPDANDSSCNVEVLDANDSVVYNVSPITEGFCLQCSPAKNRY